jgi:hypothetical protein
MSYGENMNEGIVVAEHISIRDAGLDENWLQEKICDDPSILGLGPLEVVSKERRQSSGGRLDILCVNQDDDGMYEIEIMLGQTDESHIIRTIEYWDIEKKRWPRRQHTAVLVAEKINRRFYNVIHLLSDTVPIIGIQAGLLRIDNKQILNFTKIIDSYEEPELETDLNEGVINEDVFKNKWPHVYSVWSYLRGEIESFATINRVGYRKRQISLSYGDRSRIWIANRANNQVCIKIRPVDIKGFINYLDESGVSYNEGEKVIRIKINPEKIDKYKESLQSILPKVYEGVKEVDDET